MESILLAVEILVLIFPAAAVTVVVAAVTAVAAAGEEAGWGAASGVSRRACMRSGGQAVGVADQLMALWRSRCQGSHFGNTGEQRLCESHRPGRRGTGHAGVGLCWRFFLVAYTWMPGDLYVCNYGKEGHCNGTPVFDGPTAHRCGKLHIGYRCPYPSAAAVVAVVAPFAASSYLSSLIFANYLLNGIAGHYFLPWIS